MKVIIRMILGLFGVTCSILILFSCGRSGQHKANRVLEEWIGRQVIIPNDLVYTKYGTDTVEYSQAYTDFPRKVGFSNHGKRHLVWGYVARESKNFGLCGYRRMYKLPTST